MAVTRPVEGANAAAAEEALLETAAVEGPSTRLPEVNRAEMEPTAKEVPKAGSNREGRAAGLPAAVLTPGPPRRHPRPSPEAAAGTAARLAPRMIPEARPEPPVHPAVDRPRLRREERGRAAARNTTRSTTPATGATTSPPRRTGTTRSTRDLWPTRRCSRRRGSRGSLAEACSNSRVGPADSKGRSGVRSRRRPHQRRHRQSARRSRRRQGTPSRST